MSLKVQRKTWSVVSWLLLCSQDLKNSSKLLFKTFVGICNVAFREFLWHTHTLLLFSHGCSSAWESRVPVTPILATLPSWWQTLALSNRRIWSLPFLLCNTIRTLASDCVLKFSFLLCNTIQTLASDCVVNLCKMYERRQ